MTMKTPTPSSCALIAACLLFGSAVVASAQQQPAAAHPAPDNVAVTRRPYDVAALAKAADVPEALTRGRAVWTQRCAYCHDGVGQPSYHTLGPWLGAKTVAAYGEDGVRVYIEEGNEQMPGFKHTLTEQQIKDVIDLLKGIPDSQQPTAAQLAGKSGLGRDD